MSVAAHFQDLMAWSETPIATEEGESDNVLIDVTLNGVSSALTFSGLFGDQGRLACGRWSESCAE